MNSSFYGGRHGRPFKITQFNSVEDMNANAAVVEVGDYAVIGGDEYHPEYGDWYKKEIDKFVKMDGKISGPPGSIAEVNVLNDAEWAAANHESQSGVIKGSWNSSNSGIVPGLPNGENSEILYKIRSYRDGTVPKLAMNLKIPYPSIDMVMSPTPVEGHDFQISKEDSINPYYHKFIIFPPSKISEDEVKVANSKAEAKALLKEVKVNGIVFFNEGGANG